jgi:hypothetical protein
MKGFALEESESKGKFFELLAAQFAIGKTIEEAANLANCSVSFAGKQSSSPEMRKRVDDLRMMLTSEIVGRVADSAKFAVDRLRYLSENSDSETIQLNAAKALLSSTVPVLDSFEQAKKLRELEKRIEQYELSLAEQET